MVESRLKSQKARPLKVEPIKGIEGIIKPLDLRRANQHHMTDKVREVQNFLAEKGIISSEVAIVNAAIDIIRKTPEGYEAFVKKFEDSQRELKKDEFGKYVSIRTIIGYQSAADLYEYCTAIGLTKEEVALKHGDPSNLTLLITSKSIWERNKL